MTALAYGAGKTHLAVALWIEACEQGVRTLFITATEHLEQADRIGALHAGAIVVAAAGEKP